VPEGEAKVVVALVSTSRISMEIRSLENAKVLRALFAPGCSSLLRLSTTLTLLHRSTWK